MKKALPILSIIILTILPFFLISQTSRDTYYNVIEVYTDPSIQDGDNIQVVGYYTNTDYDMLLDHYGDFMKDEVLPSFSRIILSGVVPPDNAWNGGYILVEGTVTFEPYPDHFYPNDTIMAYLDVIAVTVYIPGEGVVPEAPGDKIEKRKKESQDIDRSILNGNCDPCKFAFLLSGGGDTLNNKKKYWDNLAFLYKFKVDSLGYCDSNVFVHYFKGDPRDGSIPAGRVISADSAKIDSTFQVIAKRVAACNDNGTPATFQKMVTNHGASDGGINLLGKKKLRPEHLRDLQQKVIDSCCRTVYDEFIQCFGGHSVDAVSTLDIKNKATVYANSAVDDRSGWSSDPGVHSYLQAKINALDTGASYPAAVVKAKLAYDDYIRNIVLPYIHSVLQALRADPTIPDRQEQIDEWIADSTSAANSICESRNVTLVPFNTYCQWQEFVVPPGGQLVVEFEGESGSCGNVTVYKVDPVTGEKIKVAVWNWNHPGSWGYSSGNERRAINGELTGPTTYWVHNDNGTSRLKVHALGTPVYPESPSNIYSYPGFSNGGTDNSTAEFMPIPLPNYFVENIDQLNLSLHTLPAILGMGFVQNFGFNFQVDPANPFWAGMELVLRVADVMSPGQMLIQAPGSSIEVATLDIFEPGEYVVVLGDFRMMGPEGFISMTTMPGLQMGLDSWGLRSAVIEPLPQVVTWTGLSSSDWYDATNWSDGVVPGVYHEALIMPGPFQPVIISDVILRGITISEGASVMTAPGAMLILTGN